MYEQLDTGLIGKVLLHSHISTMQSDVIGPWRYLGIQTLSLTILETGKVEPQTKAHDSSGTISWLRWRSPFTAWAELPGWVGLLPATADITMDRKLVWALNTSYSNLDHVHISCDICMTGSIPSSNSRILYILAPKSVNQIFS
jgi:hypothetical protein